MANDEKPTTLKSEQKVPKVTRSRKGSDKVRSVYQPNAAESPPKSAPKVVPSGKKQT